MSVCVEMRRICPFCDAVYVFCPTHTTPAEVAATDAAHLAEHVEEMTAL